MDRYRRWSEAHGDPFPWVGVGFASIPVLLIVFAVWVGFRTCGFPW